MIDDARSFAMLGSSAGFSLDFLSNEIYMYNKKGFTYYSKCKIESKIDFLIDQSDEYEMPWKDLEKIVDIFDEIEKVVSRLDKSMYRKMIIDFLFNKIFHLLNLYVEFPIFRSKDAIRKYEECWNEIQSLIGDKIQTIVNR